MSSPNFICTLYLKRFAGKSLHLPATVRELLPNAYQFEHTDLPVGSGSVVTSRPPAEVYVPQRGKTLRVVSSTNYTVDESRDAIIDALSNNRSLFIDADTVRAPGFFFVEQSAPVGNVHLFSNSVGLRAYGVFCNDYTALVITDVANLRSLIDEVSTAERPFVYEFPPLSNYVSFQTRRLVTRWQRWVQTYGAAQSFIILAGAISGDRKSSL